MDGNISVVDVERRPTAHLGAHAVFLRAAFAADAALDRGDVGGNDADINARKLAEHMETGRILG